MHNVIRTHQDSLVFLGYTVTPIQLNRSGANLSHMAQWLDGPQVDLPKLKEGGVNAVFLSLVSEILRVASPESPGWATHPPTKYLEPVFKGPAEVKRVLWGIDAMHRMMEENKEVIELALTADDVERIVSSGKIAGIIHLTPAAIKKI